MNCNTYQQAFEMVKPLTIWRLKHGQEVMVTGSPFRETRDSLIMFIQVLDKDNKIYVEFLSHFIEGELIG